MKNIKKKKTSKKINNVLMVLKILEKYSDKSCFISHQQINEYIKKEYGYELKRQTIGSCIDNLIEAGYGIIKKHKHGSAYVNRNLKTEEGYFLIDAVYSSGSISRKQAKELTTNIYMMVVNAPRVAKNCQPGQFIIIKCKSCLDTFFFINPNTYNITIKI